MQKKILLYLLKVSTLISVISPIAYSGTGWPLPGGAPGG